MASDAGGPSIDPVGIVVKVDPPLFWVAMFYPILPSPNIFYPSDNVVFAPEKNASI